MTEIVENPLVLPRINRPGLQARDGVFVHHDSHGGGGTIAEGDTQWMTAGSGMLHDELPAEELVIKGGWSHGVQLWVNLPRAQKWVAPRYLCQAGIQFRIQRSAVRLLFPTGRVNKTGNGSCEVGYPGRGTGNSCCPLRVPVDVENTE